MFRIEFAKQRHLRRLRSAAKMSRWIEIEDSRLLGSNGGPLVKAWDGTVRPVLAAEQREAACVGERYERRQISCNTSEPVSEPTSKRRSPADSLPGIEFVHGGNVIVDARLH